MFKARAAVLMYHRIAEVTADPWEIAVTPEHFEQHLKVLKRDFNVQPVEQLINQLSGKGVVNKAVSITFDDGYRDNFEVAKPLLERYNLPATIFIATGFIGSEQQFWWDELAGIFLNSNQLPGDLSISINGKRLQYELNDNTADQSLQHSQTWVWPNKPPTPRCSTYLDVWKHLQTLRHEEIIQVLKELRDWSGTTAQGSNGYPMNAAQLSELTKNPLLSIGLHTEHHPALAHHSKQLQKLDIERSKLFLNKTLGLDTNLLAYPYGNYNHDTLTAVKELKLAAAFTTEPKLVDNSTDLLTIGRFQVNNWNGEEFGRRLMIWLHGS